MAGLTGFFIWCKEARAWIVRNLLNKDGLFKLSSEDINIICNLTKGTSSNISKAELVNCLLQAIDYGELLSFVLDIFPYSPRICSQGIQDRT